MQNREGRKRLIHTAADCCAQGDCPPLPLDLDPRDFVPVPLTVREGKELLALVDGLAAGPGYEPDEGAK